MAATTSYAKIVRNQKDDTSTNEIPPSANTVVEADTNEIDITAKDEKKSKSPNDSIGAKKVCIAVYGTSPVPSL